MPRLSRHKEKRSCPPYESFHLGTGRLLDWRLHRKIGQQGKGIWAFFDWQLLSAPRAAFGQVFGSCWTPSELAWVAGGNFPGRVAGHFSAVAGPLFSLRGITGLFWGRRYHTHDVAVSHLRWAPCGTSAATRPEVDENPLVSIVIPEDGLVEDVTANLSFTIRSTQPRCDYDQLYGAFSPGMDFELIEHPRSLDSPIIGSWRCSAAL